jgi:hypothetical protein
MFLTTRKLMRFIMADLSLLNAAVTELSAKVDAMNAKPAPVAPVVVDDQPAVDAVTAEVQGIVAKIPA